MEIRTLQSKGRSFFVNNCDSFVKTITELNKDQDVYFGVNERYPNCKDGDNVKFLCHIFVDIDDKDNPDIPGFELALKNNKFKYAAKIKTHDNSYHYYIPIICKLLPQGKNLVRDKAAQLLNNFKQYFKKYNIDNVFDLPRIAKVWGTTAYKYGTKVEIEEFYELSQEEIAQNTTSLNRLPEYKYEKNYTEIEHDCLFMEHYFNTKYPSNQNKNKYIHSNMIPYLKSKHPKHARELAEQVMEFQDHRSNELNTWWEKTDLQFNCGSIRNWCRRYNPDTEDFCWRCPKNEKNDISYLKDARSWPKLKKHIIEKSNMKIQWCINCNKELKGHVTITDNREIKQKITVLTVHRTTENKKYESNQLIELEDLDKPDRRYQFIGDPKPTKCKPMFNFRLKLYIYNFETIENESYVLLSEEKISLGENIITGSLIEHQDNIEIGNTIKLNSMTNILFVHSTIPSVKPIESEVVLKQLVKKYDLDEDKLYQHVFYLPEEESEEDEKYSYLHPNKFMALITAFLFSSKMKGYPLHLLILANKATGKTTLRKIVRFQMNERESIDSTGGTTLKGIIPSHANKKNFELGSLLRANRVVCWDEALRILNKISTGEDGGENLGELNDIISHDKINSSSGFHRAYDLQMRAKLLMFSNPIRVDDKLGELYEKVSPSFLDRLLIIKQDKYHDKFVKKEKGLVKNSFNIPRNEWLSIYDYMISRKSVFDKGRIKQIADKYTKHHQGELLSYWIGRFTNHHMFCLMDGIIKTRCLLENQYDFAAKDDDYVKLNDLVAYIVNGWYDMEQQPELTTVHKKIMDYIGRKGISRHGLVRWAVENNIEDDEIKFLRDNGYICLVGNDYKLLDTSHEWDWNTKKDIWEEMEE